MNKTTKAHLALLGTNIFFATNYTAIKYIVNSGLVKPFGLNFIRILATATLLWILFLFKPVKQKIPAKDWWRLLACAVCGVAINQLLFVKGLSLTLSIHATLLMLATPILITVIAAIMLKESLAAGKWLGLLLGVAGATLLVASKGSSGNADDIFWGDVYIIINAISYSFYFILVKPLMQRYNPVMVIRMLFTFGVFLVLPFCWTEFLATNWQGFNQTAWLVLALIIIGGTFLAYLFNVYGIKILGASIAGTYIYSQPAFAAVIAMIVLGEKLTWTKLLAAALIFTGVYLVTKTKKDDRLPDGKQR